MTSYTYDTHTNQTKPPSKYKIAVLTSSVGANLPVEPPDEYVWNVDYHAFLDDTCMRNMQSPTVWQTHSIHNWTIDNHYTDRRHAKIYKILPHLFCPGYDYYIWIDSTHMVHMNPDDIIDTYLKDSDIALFKHPERDCAYDEGHLVQTINFDSMAFVKSQMVFYQSQSFPKNYGLWELPCRIQRNTPEIQALMLTWWELICKYSSRDQLSLPYALSYHGIKPEIMPGKANGIRQNDILPQVVNSTHARAKNTVEFPRF